MLRIHTLILSVAAVCCIAYPAKSSDLSLPITGCWRVQRVLPTTNIASLSQADVNKLIGRQLLYSPREVVSGRTTFDAPKFSTRMISGDDFFREFFYIPLRQIEVYKKHANVVTVTAGNDEGHEFLGDTLILGGKRPVVEYKGVFLQLEQAKASACEVRKGLIDTSRKK